MLHLDWYSQYHPLDYIAPPLPQPSHLSIGPAVPINIAGTQRSFISIIGLYTCKKLRGIIQTNHYCRVDANQPSSRFCILSISSS